MTVEDSPSPLDIFGHYQERRLRCRAITMTAKNVDAIALHYAVLGKEYNTRVVRHGDDLVLELEWEIDPVEGEPALRGGLELREGEVLIRGFPPSKMSQFEFSDCWEPEVDVVDPHASSIR